MPGDVAATRQSAAKFFEPASDRCYLPISCNAEGDDCDLRVRNGGRRKPVRADIFVEYPNQKIPSPVQGRNMPPRRRSNATAKRAAG